MIHRPLTFLAALGSCRRAEDAYRHLSLAEKSALLTRAMRAETGEELRLYVQSLDRREEASEQY